MHFHPPTASQFADDPEKQKPSITVISFSPRAQRASTRLSKGPGVNHGHGYRNKMMHIKKYE
jgi:hypothetical protein